MDRNSTVSRILNSYIHATNLLRLLGYPSETSAIPLRTVCPLCEKPDLMVFEDRRGGEWHYCYNCRWAGDTIELAAQFWQVPITEAVTRLQNNDLMPDVPPGFIEDYARLHVGTRKRVAELWANAQDRVANNISDNLRNLLYIRFGLRLLSHSRWAETMRQFVGGIERRAVEHLYHPGVMEKYGRLMNSHTKIFWGRGWTDVVVIPYHDMPGRIKSFQFVGREGSSQHDNVFRNCPMYCGGFYNWKNIPSIGSKTIIGDFGLALYDVLLQPTEQDDVLGDTLFAIDDAITALQIQSRHFQDSKLPLPLVAWHDGPEGCTRWAWQTITPRQVVFWAPTLDHRLFVQAQQVNGYIAEIGPAKTARDEVVQYVSKMTPLEFLRALKRSARPWTSVLDDYVESIAPYEIEGLIRRLGLSYVQMTQLLDRCAPDTRERMLPFLNNIHGQRRIVLSSRKQIVETPDGWFGTYYVAEQLRGVLHKSALLSDAVLRIDRVLQQANNQKLFYSGRIIYRGEEVTFTVPAEELEKNTFAWMRQTLIQANKGVMIADPTSLRNPLEIALRFHKPELVTIPDAFGWDESSNRFVFPRFTIDSKGEVVKETFPSVEEGPVPAEGLTFEEFGVLDAQVLTEDIKSLKLFWAIASNVIANIMAGALNASPRGIALYGDDSNTVEQFAGWLGCPVYHLDDSITGCTSVEKLRKLTYRHGWPLIITHNDQKVSKIIQLILQQPLSCMIRVSPIVAEFLVGCHNWLSIAVPVSSLGPLGIVGGRNIREAATRILPAYLADIARRRFRLEGNVALPLARRVLVDMAQWLQRLGCNTETVLCATELMQPASRQVSQAGMLWRMIQLLKLHGDVDVVPNGFESEKSSKLELIAEPGGIWLPLKGLERILRQHDIPIDFEDLRWAFEKENAFAHTRPLKRKWLIATDWWNAQAEQWQQEKRYIG